MCQVLLYRIKERMFIMENTIISIITEKGGTGKTTTTFNLGCALGKLGKKVLLIDLDKQGNLTSYCLSD